MMMKCTHTHPDIHTHKSIAYPSNALSVNYGHKRGAPSSEEDWQRN